MTSVTRVSERFKCKTAGCPWPQDEEMHVPWCLHIEGVEHRRDQPWHQHHPKRSQGGKQIVAVLCSYCSDRVDNTPDWDNDISPGEDGKLEYILWDTREEGGWNHPLIRRVLEAGSAAATEDVAEGRGAQAGAKDGGLKGAAFESPVLPVSNKASDDVAAAPSASGEGGAAEAQDLGKVTPITPGLLNVQDAEPASAAPPSLETWCREGMQLVYMGLAFRDATDGLRFAIGDWFNKGETMMPNEVYGYLRGFEDVTVRQYSWVAGRVSPDTRVSELSWSHARAVAALPEPEQKDWLEKAQKERLTSKELNRAIHGEKPKVKRYSLDELDFLCPTCRAVLEAL